MSDIPAPANNAPHAGEDVKIAPETPTPDSDTFCAFKQPGGCRRLLNALERDSAAFNLLLTAVLVAATIWASINAIKANNVAERAAVAAERAAKSAEDSYSISKSGEAAAKEALGATKQTAEAAIKAADATAESVNLSKQANATAATVADAARLSAYSASQANEISSITAAVAKDSATKQLRAYLSVNGGSIKFDRSTRTATANVSIQNTGNSFAHRTRVTSRVVCQPKGSNQITLMGLFPSPSIGPGGNFEVKVSTTWDARFDLSQMESWVDGKVEYFDEFGAYRYTNFRFKAGESINNNTYQLQYDVTGNDAQ